MACEQKLTVRDVSWAGNPGWARNRRPSFSTSATAAIGVSVMSRASRAMLSNTSCPAMSAALAATSELTELTALRRASSLAGKGTSQSNSCWMHCSASKLLSKKPATPRPRQALRNAGSMLLVSTSTRPAYPAPRTRPSTRTPLPGASDRSSSTASGRVVKIRLMADSSSVATPTTWMRGCIAIISSRWLRISSESSMITMFIRFSLRVCPLATVCALRAGRSSAKHGCVCRLRWIAV